MDEIYTYFVPMPAGVHEFVTPCVDGYTVYIDESLDETHRMAAYRHAMKHVNNNDFKKDDAQEVEASAHGTEGKHGKGTHK